MARLIVVDDEPAFRDMVAGFLVSAGHGVRATGDGSGLRRLLAEEPADLVLLDLGLPGEDGLSIARDLRARHGCGIIMLTGADGVIDRVVGLEIGADDYVTKPVSLPELAARVEAVMRRRRTLGTRVAFGAFTLDLKAWTVTDPQGLEMDLSAAEIDLIAAFATNPGKVLTRDDILRLAPAQGDDPMDRSIDSRIARLRRKLERRGVEGDLIGTARGAGYVYHPPQAAG